MTSLEFAELARRLSAVTRRSGQAAPLFRSPPRRAGVDRSLSRRADGSATVSVRLKGRHSMAVAADMIDGIIAVNHLSGSAAGAARDNLWHVAGELLAPTADVVPIHAGVRAA